MTGAENPNDIIWNEYRKTYYCPKCRRSYKKCICDEVTYISGQQGFIICERSKELVEMLIPPKKRHGFADVIDPLNKQYWAYTTDGNRYMYRVVKYLGGSDVGIYLAERIIRDPIP